MIESATPACVHGCSYNTFQRSLERSRTGMADQRASICGSTLYCGYCRGGTSFHARQDWHHSCLSRDPTGVLSALKLVPGSFVGSRCASVLGNFVCDCRIGVASRGAAVDAHAVSSPLALMVCVLPVAMPFKGVLGARRVQCVGTFAAPFPFAVHRTISAEALRTAPLSFARSRALNSDTPLATIVTAAINGAKDIVTVLGALVAHAASRTAVTCTFCTAPLPGALEGARVPVAPFTAIPFIAILGALAPLAVTSTALVITIFKLAFRPSHSPSSSQRGECSQRASQHSC